MNKIYDVAIIGAGPGGVATAIECKVNGIENVILFEKTDRHFATFVKYYKDGKRVDKDYKGQVVDLKGHIPFKDGNKESTIELFDTYIKKHNVEIKYNSEIENVKQVNDHFSISSSSATYNAKFVIVSIGKMGQPNKPSYPLPPKYRKKINYNVNECLNTENILVVGGGNSAVEYAISLNSEKINDAKITLNYRKNEFSRINDENAKNLTESLKNGLISKFGIDIKSVEDGGNDKIKVNFTDESHMFFDRIIYAIGGVTPVDFLSKCGINLDSNKVPIVNEFYETNIPNLFVLGDIMFKNGGSVALAMDHGFTIVNLIKSKL